MPPKREHLRASRILLGTQHPAVHTFLDEAVKQFGAKHRYLSHNVEYLEVIERYFGGTQAKREGMLHLLQDWGIVTEHDVDNFPSSRRVRKTSLEGKRTTLRQ